MKCIIGLGNIGKEYEKTRHNFGFITVDYLAQKYGIVLDKKKKKCIYGEGLIQGQKVLLVKPTTYMNLSGEAVVEILNWYKLSNNDIVVVYDDIDLKFKEVRYREKGSSGTHNGMRNIISHLKTEEFSRIRIGIENRQETQIPLADYVLQKFTKPEMNVIEKEILPQVEENALNFLTK